MSKPRDIPQTVTALQTQASAPHSSAWVEANAGSGKTHVLAQRVIRLLLEGIDPAKILCITFTKAAAANMANRVFDELRRWTALDDAKLDAAIKLIANIDPDPHQRKRARQLFARALELLRRLKLEPVSAVAEQGEDKQPAPIDPVKAQMQARVNTPDPSLVCPVKYLFIDCLPGKGWPEEHRPHDVREFWHSTIWTAERYRRENPAPDS